jgi:peptide/nickel transport system ATP-binding protein
MERMEPLLDICNLHVHFGATHAVRGISLQIYPGESLGLVGESGSGKSVTSLAVMGLLGKAAKMEGEIRWRGASGTIDLAQLSTSELRTIRGCEIAMIFQEPMTALNPVMSIGRQVAECGQAHGMSARDARQKALEMLEAVSIPEPARRFGDYPHQFSGGQRQRILIAMALMNRPRLLIADEPTTALDVTVQAQILSLLAKLQREFQLSMLFISHDLAVIGKVASRICVMRGGHIVESGSVDSILRAPQHEYTRSLLAAVPTLHTDRNEPLATLP